MTAAVLDAPAVLPPAMRPVASYGRRSKRQSGDGRGATINIADQHEQNTSYAAQVFPGADVVTYDDNMSAWNPDAYRAGWEAMLADVRAGKYRAVIGRYADRLTRQPEQGERLLAACRASGTELHTTSGGHIASALAFRIELAIAAEESDQKSRRMKDHHRRASGAGTAKAGKFHGGRRRFGYNEKMTETLPDEAEAIREIAGRLLNGESLASCARWLAAEGIGRWTGPNLRTLMLREYLAGLRVYQGEVVGRGDWPAILDVATHEALKLKLGDPSRRTSYTNARTYLLAGLARCGECGTTVRGRSGGTKHPERRSYACYGCGKVHRNVADVDRRVTLWVVERLTRVDARGSLATDSASTELAELTAKRRAIEPRRERLAEQNAAGFYDDDPDGYRLASKALTAEAKRLDAAIAAASEVVAAPQRALEGLTGPDPAVGFAELPLGRQRAIIDLLATVTINRAAHKGAAFDPEAVVIEAR